ncbi:MAG: T9SS type A sorting domain-containing protein [Flavobacteriales bacterium]|nr:T9SS type A sorting domain-containing protein [Flavobacteriales bacterium]
MKTLACLAGALCVLFAGNVNATTYYVSPNGDNASSGLTKDQPWRTISYAAGSSSPVTAGDKVYVKAGNYGSEYISFAKSGTVNNPIVFEGYQNTPGDAPDLNFQMGDALNASVMPLLDGGNRGNYKIGMNLPGRSYIVIRNFQITNYSYGVNTGNAHHLVLDNIITMYTGAINDSYSGRGIQLGSWSTAVSSDNVVSNCIVVNSAAEGLSINGHNNKVTNCKVYCNEGVIGSGNNAATDYYLLVDGNNNEITDCYVERIGDLAHYGHGIGAKWDCEYNVFTNCTAVNMTEDFYVRHRGAKYNIFVGCHAINGRAFVVRDGASFNRFIDCRADDVKSGIRFMDTTEDGGAQYAGRHNTFENCIINKAYLGVHFDDYDQVSPADSNTIAFCIFNRVDYLFYCGRPNSNNEMLNCIVTNSGSLKAGSYALNFDYAHSAFYGNSFTTPSGTGNMTSNPMFVNESTGDFHIQAGSPCIDNGIEAPFVEEDFDGEVRPYGSGYDIGAFEYHPQVPFSATTKSSNVTCYGASNGSASAVPAGGAQPYTYEWSNGETTSAITGLTSGYYYVTINDNNGSFISLSVHIGQPAQLLINNMGVVDATNCDATNGKVTVSATGGMTSSSYTYKWNTSPVQKTATATGLTPGQYTVTVTDVNGCSVQGTATVKGPDPLMIADVVAVNASNCSASNGKLTALVEGGSASYSYLWNTTPAQTTATATGLTPGTYSVVVTDAYGCIVQATASVDGPAPLVISNLNVTDASNCEGNNGKVSVSVAGGSSAYSFTWDTNPVQTTSTATGLHPGDYSVVIIDANGCSVTASATVQGRKPLVINKISSEASTNCDASDGTASVIASGGAGGTYMYEWDTNPVQTAATATGLYPGVYTVTVTDAQGCKALATDTVACSITTGSDQPLSATLYNVFPNPVRDRVMVKAGVEIQAVSVITTTGQTVYELEVNGQKEVSIDLNALNLSPGIYFLNIRNDEGVKAHRIVKE